MAHVAVVSAFLRVVAQVMLSITEMTSGVDIVYAPELPEFDFATLALGLGSISLLLCGVLLAGSALFPGTSEKVKREYIPNTIIGLIIVGIASFIIGILSPA